MRFKIIFVCLIALILTALPVTVFAQELDYGRTGSISVTLSEQISKTPIAGAELSVYHVATVKLNSSGHLSFTYKESFKNCGIALEDEELANKLDQFLNDHLIEAKKVVTDSEGRANCTKLELGLYFVKQTNTVSGFAPCKSFLVTVPLYSDGEYRYDVEGTPKTEIAKRMSITIKKVWNEDETVSIPDSVTVQLLRNDTVVETATLNSQNEWQITFDDMPESDDYRVEEIDIPQGFTVTYEQNGSVFIVINTAALIRTGQLTWPIPLFAVVGMLLLAVGTAILHGERT